MSGDDAPREALVGVLAYWYPDAGTGQAHTPEEHLRAADAVLALPEMEAWVERRARERAAEELRAAADEFEPKFGAGSSPRWLRDRADALTADDRTGQP